VASRRVKPLLELIAEERVLATDLQRRRIEIGARLRKQRETLGLSMTEMRLLSGVIESTISLLERGRIWKPAAARLLADAIDKRTTQEARRYTIVEHVAS